ncbi:hypothetical protein ACFL2X_01375 [Candidatus Latescibacterota bacterium]
MKNSGTLKNIYHIVAGLFRYNLKIIFANKFLYFLFTAIIIFVFITAMNLFNSNSAPTEATGYWLILIPGILLVFYPTTFGIQNDVDTRMIEILFGIPNYRYKVWIVRLLLIFLVTFVNILILTSVFSFVLKNVPVLMMGVQLMFPILFIGSLAFLFSTIVRNGNGTAVVMVITGMIFWIAKGQIGNSEWNLFLNPYAIPTDMNEAIWAETIFNNRLYLLIGTAISILYGLLNLQKREKFI